MTFSLPSSERYQLVLITLLMTGYIIFAMASGPDFDWDLRNYHLYAGYKFLHGGFEQNLFPSQVQSWFNPLLDALTVSLMETLPPLGVGISLAFLQSLNVPLLYILIRQNFDALFPNMSDQQRSLARGCALVLGATGCMTLSELGGSFGDLLASIPLLISLVALIQSLARNIEKRRAFIWMSLSGLALGLGIGLKLTAAIYLPGCISIILFTSLKRPQQRFRELALFGFFMFTGVILTDGFWLWGMAETTQNPFFPALNGLFHSPWINSKNNLLDDRFQARSLWQIFCFPFEIALNRHSGSELPYYDLRLPIIWLLAPLPFYLLWRDRSKAALRLPLFFIITYGVWVLVFGIMRYIVGLEFLSGLVLIYLCRSLPSPKSQLYGIMAVTTLICLSTRVPTWSSDPEWVTVEDSNNWFNVRVAPELIRPDALFLMLGDAPMSYVIPQFDRKAIFVRMEGNLRLSPDDILSQKRSSVIASHEGSLWTLAPTRPSLSQRQLLSNYGLELLVEPCFTTFTTVENLISCPLGRTK